MVTMDIGGGFDFDLSNIHKYGEQFLSTSYEVSLPDVNLFGIAN